MKEKIVISLIIIFSAGCNSIRNLSVEQFECSNESFRYDSSLTDNEGVKYYIQEEFVYNATEKYTVESLIEQYDRFLELEKTPTRNIHDTTIVDTIYEFKNKNNIISFYRARHKDLLKEFDVSSSVFPLHGCVSVELPKDSLANKFGIKEPLSDTIRIGDEERSTVFTFYFSKGKIDRIISMPYFD
ncbi:MAG: hypothetical protein R6U04_06615 [Bacteroidales bacterium]